MDSPSTTPTTEADQSEPADAAPPDTVVKIPWHLLGAIECLTRGDYTAALHSALLAPPVNHSRLRTALKATQNAPKTTVDGLLDRVSTVANGFPKDGGYDWSISLWPAAFPIRLRMGVSELILTKGGLVVPWPWPGASGDTLGVERGKAFGNNDPVTSYTVQTADLRLGAFMYAADAAVTTEKDAFKTQARDDATAEAWIKRRAETAPGYVGPHPFTVSWDESRAPTATEWEVNTGTGALRLRLGVSHLKGLAEIVMDKWPCGAFVL